MPLPACAPAGRIVTMSDEDAGGLTFRPGAVTDLERCQAIERAGDAQFVDAGHHEFAGAEPIDATTYRAAVEAGRVTVAEIDGTVVGWCLLARTGDELAVGQICVDPAMQGRGIGTALMHVEIERAARAGEPTLVLSTQSDIAWNRPWYESLGFELVEPGAWTAGMHAVTAAETAAGLDWRTRVHLRLTLSPGTASPTPTIVRIGQLSDTHFLEPGEQPEGSHGYDTWAAFEAVLEHLGDHGHLDLIVVTGDVADHGRPAQYALAARAFGRFTVPVNVCPGNHDNHVPYLAGVGQAGAGTDRVVELGDWAFLFVDSNAGMMTVDGQGNLVDPPGDARLHANGALGEREATWIRDTYAATAARHVFIWVHHPPGVDVALCADDGYSAEWDVLLNDLPRVRGIGAGHSHVPRTHEFAGRPVFVAPSLKNNFDLDADTWLPPGYRTYAFHPDGTITAELHLVDDERWPRRPLGRAVRSLLQGQLTYAQLAEIMARRS